MHYFYLFLIAFALTNLIEFIPFNFFVKLKIKPKIIALILINSITLPVVWLILPFFATVHLIALPLIECAVVIAETFLIKIMLKQKLSLAFKTAFIMNLLSTIAGLILF